LDYGRGVLTPANTGRICQSPRKVTCTCALF
jgi:hypothetical protein